MTAQPPAQPSNAVPSSSFLHQPHLEPAPSAAATTASSTTPALSAPLETATPASAPSISLTAAPPTPIAPNKFDNPLSDAARAAKSASQWNGLLKWARGVRLASGGVGGGWEWGTGMYHVPRESPEYYSGVERAEVDSSAPRSTRPTTITSHALDAISDDEDSLAVQENLSGRPKRRAAGRSGYAD